MRSFAIAASLVLAGCKSASAPSPPANEKPSFTVTLDGNSAPGGTLNLAVDVKGTQRDGSLIEVAGRAVQKIGTDLITGHPMAPGDYPAINIVFRSDKPSDQDEASARFLHVSFKDQELRQMTHFGAQGDALLASATEVGWWSPRNDDVVNGYCASQATSAFCDKFVRDRGL